MGTCGWRAVCKGQASQRITTTGNQMGLCKPQLEAVRLLQYDNQISDPDAKVLHKLTSTLMPLGEGGEGTSN